MPDATPNAEIVSPDVVESMGISQAAFQEVQAIIGRMPTIEELSTLLAMWNANGRQQSLYGWLRGQHYAVERHEYLYSGTDQEYLKIQEPKIRQCLDIARALYPTADQTLSLMPFHPASEVFMVGNINTDFLHSTYAEQFLHLAHTPFSLGSAEADLSYHHMILDALLDNHTLLSKAPIASGGLFRTLIESGRQHHIGVDILTCREVRIDAFLFGEEPGRILVSIPDTQEDFFLQKMDEAQISCVLLGRTTKGRILIDGFDFGPIQSYLYHTANQKDTPQK